MLDICEEQYFYLLRWKEIRYIVLFLENKIGNIFVLSLSSTYLRMIFNPSILISSNILFNSLFSPFNNMLIVELYEFDYLARTWIAKENDASLYIQYNINITLIVINKRVLITPTVYYWWCSIVFCCCCCYIRTCTRISHWKWKFQVVKHITHKRRVILNSDLWYYGVCCAYLSFLFFVCSCVCGCVCVWLIRIGAHSTHTFLIYPHHNFSCNKWYIGH